MSPAGGMLISIKALQIVFQVCQREGTSTQRRRDAEVAQRKPLLRVDSASLRLCGLYPSRCRCLEASCIAHEIDSVIAQLWEEKVRPYASRLSTGWQPVVPPGTEALHRQQLSHLTPSRAFKNSLTPSPPFNFSHRGSSSPAASISNVKNGQHLRSRLTNSAMSNRCFESPGNRIA